MTRVIDFSNYSTIKIGQKHPVEVLEEKIALPKGGVIVGGCSNTLVGKTPPPLFMLGKTFDYIYLKENLLYVGGATPNGKIVSFCKKHNIGGFEFLSHLPGKIGGAVAMNAGLKEYETFNHLKSIATHNKVVKKENIDYGYRYAKVNEIVYEVVFYTTKGFSKERVEFFKSLRANQPKEPSLGSCFKNPPNDYAGRLIEAVGLKAKQHGGVCFSEKHANFLIHCGGGSYEDAIWLINKAKKMVYEAFGIELELEIQLLDGCAT